jgi:hypothetical protein
VYRLQVYCISFKGAFLIERSLSDTLFPHNTRYAFMASFTETVGNIVAKLCGKGGKGMAKDVGHVKHPKG